jgi:hypothetical protein
MFIETDTAGPALRQEGDVYRTRDGRARPPSGGRCSQKPIRPGPPSVRRAMFIETDMAGPALRQEVNVYRNRYGRARPPSGGQCL